MLNLSVLDFLFLSYQNLALFYNMVRSCIITAILNYFFFFKVLCNSLQKLFIYITVMFDHVLSYIVSRCCLCTNNCNILFAFTLRIWSHLLKKSLMEYLIFYEVLIFQFQHYFASAIFTLSYESAIFHYISKNIFVCLWKRVPKK